MGSITINISGSTKDPATSLSDEQALLDDLLALVKNHPAIDIANASMEESGNIDLVAAANEGSSAPGDGGGTGGDTTAPATDEATGFVWKLNTDADYNAMLARLVAFNAGKDSSAQVAQPYMTETVWDDPSTPVTTEASPTIG